ncbi:hypothetical protein T265_04226 [Opisthorchis viverrini]|uniref:Uncharacterized protein n=1 Tax=Opisthorchis viverrini TaxID=6198 RepID=A0A074ZNR7_OPIVI|nr:hypothetical protein T265_04226 [Opisthorchis viverrini]KER29038.1 hypothetical protein T265_04226 [Opisthorchis viverrini]
MQEKFDYVDNEERAPTIRVDDVGCVPHSKREALIHRVARLKLSQIAGKLGCSVVKARTCGLESPWFEPNLATSTDPV